MIVNEFCENFFAECIENLDSNIDNWEKLFK